MYMDYHEPGLHGIGKKLKKLVKPVAHIAAAVVTGGASLAVTAAMLAAEKQKKAQAAAQAEAIRQEQALAKIMGPPLIKEQPPIAPAIVPPSGGMPIVSVAPSATPPPQYVPMPASPPQYMTQPGDAGGMTMSAGGGQPSWMMPAMIGGGVLLAAMMFRGGSRQ